MKKPSTLLAILLALNGCANIKQSPTEKAQVSNATVSGITKFSSSTGDVPSKWQPLIINKNKKPTQYQLRKEQGKTVLHAQANAASSGLIQQLTVDPNVKPWLSWQWRISQTIESADNFEPDTEDSPVRIVLGFDGDKDKMPFADQILFETAKVLTGQDYPYATLMYIWENKAQVGTVISSTRTSRVKMIVAASGPEGAGQWHKFNRNIAEDFEKAFGEKPGPLIGIGVLTDTDNTGGTVEAWYGDIELLSNPDAIKSAKK